MTDEEKAEEFAKGQCKFCEEHCGEVYHFNLAKINFELEKENEELSNSVTELTNTKTELENKVTELKQQIEKMKCCENCKKHRNCECSEDKKFYARIQRQCDEWE